MRKKILIAALVLTILFLVLYGVGLHFAGESLALSSPSIGDGMRADGNAGATDIIADTVVQQTRNMLLILGIYFSSSIVSLLAIFSSVGAISSEIESGMLHAILAKPIKRQSVVLGKFLGYASMLIFYSGLLIGCVLGLNYYFLLTSIDNVLPIILLFVAQPLIVLSVALAGSTKLTTLANGITVFMLYTIGVVGGMVEQIGAIIRNQTLVKTGIITSLVIPVDSLYRMIVANVIKETANPLTSMFYGPFGVISQPSNAMAIYTAIYIIAFLFVAVRAFLKRDIN